MAVIGTFSAVKDGYAGIIRTLRWRRIITVANATTRGGPKASRSPKTFPVEAERTTISAIPVKAAAIAAQVRRRTGSPRMIQPSSAAMNGAVESTMSVLATWVSESEST